MSSIKWIATSMNSVSHCFLMNFSETDVALLYEHNVYCFKMVYEYLKLDFLGYNMP